MTEPSRGLSSAGPGWSDCALVLCDLQNDFVHPNGAYGRGGAGSKSIMDVVRRLKPVVDGVRREGGVVIGTQFTLVPGRGGEPLIAAHLQRMRPFLGRGDFAPGSWGQQVVDELGQLDAYVEKVAYSAFYQTRLEWLLGRLGVRRVAIAGVMTNGGVASTLRDAAVRDYPVILLTDGCAAPDERSHLATLDSLKSIATLMTCQDLLAALGPAGGQRS
jgi:nicotinamidase-related amidase